MTDKNELPDGGLSKSTAKRVTALAAASVSERALEWLDAYDNAVSDLFADEETGWNEGNRRHWMRRRIARLRAILIAALEQALTQQRVCATCGGRGEIGGHVGQMAETFDYVTEPCPECTTPQPSADAVQELVKRWRGLADSGLRRSGTWDGKDMCDRIESMADELESLLSGGSHA